MIISNLVGIIADDLTGANDTALQFKKCNAKTKIMLDYTIPPENDLNTEIWAISTESRNISSDDAKVRIVETITNLNKNLNLEYFYKKIDSTLRGNIAVETLAMLNSLEYDAAIIIPAFPSEGRITVGGYHLSKGVPIGRTEMARDPHSPITESHVPSLFISQLEESERELVATIGLKTVMNGAGPVLMKMNELIKEGKKLLIADSSSLTDIEQLVLAIDKSNYKILPVGTAAMANLLAKHWLPETDEEECVPVEVPRLPRLIISGSATQINSNQIEQLEKSYDYDIVSIALSAETILGGVKEDYVNDIVSKLGNDSIVLIHSSKLLDNFDGFSDASLKDELTRAKFAGKITDYLAELTKQIVEKKQVMLITLGGETSYKCCNAISAKELTMMDEVAPAIALCIDNEGQYIITKSGNLGQPRTLIDILNYIDKHESKIQG
ncbi:MAG: hypothetical protein K6E29_08540 [Cyanobacteria bacterium RUI128]|nr:hypothetical protein [Cyanobacteria bacterium RUI128]